ncbi:MAG TPA: hypothetical protein VMT58_01720 [Candidatus Binataceae bacterium]|nr:hypothetical protein [Candidatus Binataceae bacterium]
MIRSIIPGIVVAALGALSLSLVANRNASARGGYSLASLKGSYAGIFSGQVNTDSGLVPILGTGIFISDGKGGLTGHESYTFGTTTCDSTISGSYTMSPDGTGTDSITDSSASPGCSGGSYTQSLAIGDKGKLVLLSNNNGDQINEEWHSQK